jgi:hypothetical protein
MTQIGEKQYPMLEEYLSNRRESVKPAYSTRDVATLFSVSIRAIQQRIAQGQIVARDLPGRFKILPGDLEEFFERSRKERH